MSDGVMGRPTKYRPEFVEQARKLAALGATDREAADFFEVDEATIHRWKHTHPDFCESLKVGKETADARVEQSLYRRALGYSHDAVKMHSVEGTVVTTPYVEHYPPDTTAAIFWLKNRKPTEWRDKTVVEHDLPEDMAKWLGER
ncbi:helix-turn-helix domain-containing protein [Sphingomonas sp. T9W2]|uniref:helix-turn-helix domain-containing protein n=1 Tax=Sphingomonas sp. T9W2 TaxID=3143183 RepID=UPI0031F4C1C7